MNDNLLAIELKKMDNQRGRAKDRRTFKKITKLTGYYGYQFRLFLDVDKTIHEIQKTWYRDGYEVS